MQVSTSNIFENIFEGDDGIDASGPNGSQDALAEYLNTPRIKGCKDPLKYWYKQCSDLKLGSLSRLGLDYSSIPRE